MDDIDWDLREEMYDCDHDDVYAYDDDSWEYDEYERNSEKEYEAWYEEL